MKREEVGSVHGEEKEEKRRRRAACTEEKKDERGIYFLFIFCGFQDPDSTLECSTYNSKN